VWTDGTVIYSYAMPIAVRTATGIKVSQDSPTVTTTIHRNNVRDLLSRAGLTVEMVPASAVRSAAQEVRP
jgi:hypothetical protein